MKKTISSILLVVGAVSFLTAKLHETLQDDAGIGKWLGLMVYLALIVLVLVSLLKQFRGDDETDEDRLDVTVPYTKGMKCLDAITLVVVLASVVMFFMQGLSMGLKSLALLSIGAGFWLKADDPQSEVIDANDQWELTAYSWHYRVEGLLIQLMLFFLALMVRFFNDAPLPFDAPKQVAIPLLCVMLFVVLIAPLVVTRVAIRRRRKRMNPQNVESNHPE